MSALLLTLLLQTAVPAPTPSAPPGSGHALEAGAQAPEPSGPEAPGPAHATQAEAHAPAGETGLGATIMHHVTDQPVFGLPSKHMLYFALAALLVILMSQLALRSYRGGQVPRGLGAAVETVVLFVRDDIAEPNIGHEGRKFTPLLCSFFFFILVAALLGLVPLPGYQHGKWSLSATTSTGNLAVTMGLALVSFVAQQYAGISKYGVVHHLRNLIPPGLPWPLLPLMAIVELVGVFTKPFALMIRLFANMLAGHMVVTTLILLISLMGRMHWLGGVAIAPISIGLSLFIMLLEVLVAFIQAYIFTLLSAVFIGMYAHPAH